MSPPSRVAPPPPRIPRPGRWRQPAALGHLAGFLAASSLIDRLWRVAGTATAAGPSALDSATGFPLAEPLEGTGEWLASLVCGAILPATLEELFFRGLVFEILRRRQGETAAIAFSALLFGLAHPGLPHATAAGILGLYLGTLRARWGLALPIAAHALNNALALISGAMSRGNHLADPWLWLAIGLVGNSIATLRQEMRNAQPRP